MIGRRTRTRGYGPLLRSSSSANEIGTISRDCSYVVRRLFTRRRVFVCPRNCIKTRKNVVANVRLIKVALLTRNVTSHYEREARAVIDAVPSLVSVRLTRFGTIPGPLMRVYIYYSYIARGLSFRNDRFSLRQRKYVGDAISVFGAFRLFGRAYEIHASRPCPPPGRQSNNNPRDENGRIFTTILLRAPVRADKTNGIKRVFLFTRLLYILVGDPFPLAIQRPAIVFRPFFTVDISVSRPCRNVPGGIRHVNVFFFCSFVILAIRIFDYFGSRGTSLSRPPALWGHRPVRKFRNVFHVLSKFVSIRFFPSVYTRRVIRARYLRESVFACSKNIYIKKKKNETNTILHNNNVVRHTRVYISNGSF